MGDASIAFKGTGADQDPRFLDKMKKFKKNMKFPKVFNSKVDFAKVEKSVIKWWMTNRITELLGLEDDVVVNYAVEMLETEIADPREWQIQLTGFLQQHAYQFMEELWKLLLSAQQTVGGVPREFLERKRDILTEQARREAAVSQAIHRAQLDASNAAGSRSGGGGGGGAGGSSEDTRRPIPKLSAADVPMGSASNAVPVINSRFGDLPQQAPLLPGVAPTITRVLPSGRRTGFSARVGDDSNAASGAPDDDVRDRRRRERSPSSDSDRPTKRRRSPSPPRHRRRRSRSPPARRSRSPRSRSRSPPPPRRRSRSRSGSRERISREERRARRHKQREAGDRRRERKRSRDRSPSLSRSRSPPPPRRGSSASPERRRRRLSPVLEMDSAIAARGNGGGAEEAVSPSERLSTEEREARLRAQLHARTRE